ncbi:hypothetical protein CEXT_663301 [Caerostris extrusa]|uniref:Uncharacterized protein n=1 Tax=Caerostris extrusa TaxID=172846 RepID=A0AAV4T522_CAEEX|nr:hypothetical protein CEXT_663301 [Caerostris extrusa]
MIYSKDSCTKIASPGSNTEKKGWKYSKNKLHHPLFYLTTSFRKRSFHTSSIRKTLEMRHPRDLLNTHRGMSYAAKSGGTLAIIVLRNHSCKCPDTN